jgi:hypothetical protein
MEKTTTTEIIEGRTFEFTSEVFEGNFYDTRVTIVQGSVKIYICDIAGYDIPEFKKQLKTLLKLRI